MTRERLAAFTDGVFAVIITIMVLELKAPHQPTLAALGKQWPVFASYVLSFLYVAIYWNNHHHFLHLVRRVDGRLLWANLNLLFWVSLVPFTTAWLGENETAAVPTAIYGVSLLAPALAWWGLEFAITASQPDPAPIRAALGENLKGKASPVIYLTGIGLAFINTWIADLCYLAVAVMWFVPDRRIERALAAGEE